MFREVAAVTPGRAKRQESEKSFLYWQIRENVASGDLTPFIIRREMTAGRREALLQALGAYRGENPRDEVTISRFRAFLERDDPFRRSDSEGHVTASAVVARPSGDAFLLVFHRKLDRWLQPGGHVEDGDTSVFDAALREAREETGISDFEAPLGDGILDLDVHAIPAFGDDPAHFHYDVRFLLTVGNSGKPAPGAAWFPFDAVRTADTDGSLVRAVHKAAIRLTRR
jgi:8-oxo-dGTP pyrophosphatase MutT (NUDIX family)